jgi:hypothetical protein
MMLREKENDSGVKLRYTQGDKHREMRKRIVKLKEEERRRRQCYRQRDRHRETSKQRDKHRLRKRMINKEEDNDIYNETFIDGQAHKETETN